MYVLGSAVQADGEAVIALTLHVSLNSTWHRNGRDVIKTIVSRYVSLVTVIYRNQSELILFCLRSHLRIAGEVD